MQESTLFSSFQNLHFLSVFQCKLTFLLHGSFLTCLTLSNLGKEISKQHYETFFVFFTQTGHDTSCEMSDFVFCGKIRTNIVNLLSAELAKREIKVNNNNNNNSTKNLNYFSFSCITSWKCHSLQGVGVCVRSLQRTYIVNSLGETDDCIH